MTRAHLASLALAVTTLGSTGCSIHHRHYIRYGCHGPAVYARPAAPPAPVEVAPPPAPVPAYAASPRPIIVYANVPRTMVIVINPPGGGPPVVQQIAPQAPPAAPRPAPQPEAQPKESPDGWFDD